MICSIWYPFIVLCLHGLTVELNSSFHGARLGTQSLVLALLLDLVPVNLTHVHTFELGGERWKKTERAPRLVVMF